MKVSEGGKQPPLTAAQKKARRKASEKADASNPRAIAFAKDQLRKAGIKPTETGDVTAQFRKMNAEAANKRRAAGLARAGTVGASSSLTAGMRGKVVKKPVVKKTTVVKKPTKTTKTTTVKNVGFSNKPPKATKPSAAKRKAQGY